MIEEKMECGTKSRNMGRKQKSYYVPIYERKMKY